MHSLSFSFSHLLTHIYCTFNLSNITLTISNSLKHPTSSNLQSVPNPWVFGKIYNKWQGIRDLLTLVYIQYKQHNIQHFKFFQTSNLIQTFFKIIKSMYLSDSQFLEVPMDGNKILLQLYSLLVIV